MVIMENFPGGLVVKTPCFQCRGHRFDPWSGKFHMPQRVWQKGKKKKIVIIERVWVWKSESPGVQTLALPILAVKWGLTPCSACMGSGSTATRRGRCRVKLQKRALPSLLNVGHTSAWNSADPLLIQRDPSTLHLSAQTLPPLEARLLPHCLVIFNIPVPQLLHL